MGKFYLILFLLNSFFVHCFAQTSDSELIKLFGEEEIFVESVVVLNIDTFNTKIVESFSSKEEWTKEPLFIALKYCGIKMMGNRKEIEISVTPREINSDTKIKSETITITNLGFTDDSVGGDRYRIHIIRNKEDIWQLSYVIWAKLCSRVERTFYSANPCP